MPNDPPRTSRAWASQVLCSHCAVSAASSPPCMKNVCVRLRHRHASRGHTRRRGHLCVVWPIRASGACDNDALVWSGKSGMAQSPVVERAVKFQGKLGRALLGTWVIPLQPAASCLVLSAHPLAAVLVSHVSSSPEYHSPILLSSARTHTLASADDGRERPSFGLTPSRRPEWEDCIARDGPYLVGPSTIVFRQC